MSLPTRITYEFRVKLRGPWGRFVGTMPYYIADPKQLQTMSAAEMQEHCRAKVEQLALKLLDLLGATPSTGVEVTLRRRIENL